MEVYQTPFKAKALRTAARLVRALRSLIAWVSPTPPLPSIVARAVLAMSMKCSGNRPISLKIDQQRVQEVVDGLMVKHG